MNENLLLTFPCSTSASSPPTTYTWLDKTRQKPHLRMTMNRKLPEGLGPYPYSEPTLISSGSKLEFLAVEIQVMILRQLLPPAGSCICIEPELNKHDCLCGDQYFRRSFTGVFRVSKHLSRLALQIYYGENVFNVGEGHYDFNLIEFINPKEVSFLEISSI